VGGSPGKGSGLNLLPAFLPLIGDQANPGQQAADKNPGTVLMSNASSSPVSGKPVKSITAAGHRTRRKHATPVPGATAKGALRASHTPQQQTLKIHLLWDELEVPDGADDYETSRHP